MTAFSAAQENEIVSERDMVAVSVDDFAAMDAVTARVKGWISRSVALRLIIIMHICRTLCLYQQMRRDCKREQPKEPSQGHSGKGRLQLERG